MALKPSYRIVRLANGVTSLRSELDEETFHPVAGPQTESANLYVQQLRLPERLAAHPESFVVWDVGLGAAANSIAFLRAAEQIPGFVQLLSFDATLAPLRFALEHSDELGYFGGFHAEVNALAEQGHARFQARQLQVHWELILGDFPTLIAAPESRLLHSPDAILFDPFSPAKNPSMWTEALFANLFTLVKPGRPCILASYTRSTLVRVALLLAGFYVGAGQATGEKEETTVAANTLTLIDQPLDRRWLSRVRRSTSAEPLSGATYRQEALSASNWERLLAHPQFQ